MQTAWNKGLPKEQQPFYNKKVSETHKLRISKANKGKKRLDLSERNKSLENRLKVSKTKKGISTWWCKGKHLSEETKQKIRLANKGKKRSEETRKKNSLNMLGNTRSKIPHPWLKNPEFMKKRLQGLLKRPTSPERMLLKIIEENNLSYKYVGNGNFIIQGFNPDFINCNGQKKIIEVYGDYWHNKEERKIRDKFRLETFAKYGYKTLIIWEHEFKDLHSVLKKVKEFD